MHAPPILATIDADPPIPFTDEQIGSAAHEKHMPSVRAIAVDEIGLVLLNLIGADASVSAVIMELLRSKSNGVGFMPTLFASQPTNIPTQLAIQKGGRYTTFRSALATSAGSIKVKNWCLLINTANLAESLRRAPTIPAELLPPPPAPAIVAPSPPQGAVQSPPAAPPPHYVIGAATSTTPDPNALLGQLRSIGVVLADVWATAVCDLALEAQLVTPIPAAGVKCWRVDGDLVRWVDLVKHGIQHQRFWVPEVVTRQQRAA
jgi:hypothetical protein